MKIKSHSKFKEVLIFEPNVYEDKRGLFFESFNLEISSILDVNFVQDNHSVSKKNIIRGIHYQWDPPMGKLCRVGCGGGRDFFIDLRKGSSTYGEYDFIDLNEENKKIIWIPSGFGHAFLSLRDNTHLLYKCSAYHSDKESAIFPFDKFLSIKWGIDKQEITLSDKDSNSKSFEEYDKNPKFHI